MTARLIMAIVSTMLEEAALVAIGLWGLPQIGVHIPLAGLVALMVAWGAYAVFTYKIGSRVLGKKPLINMTGMVGSKGKVVSPLAPEGMVKIKGELWVATSDGGEMYLGEEIVVVGQDKLKLIVRASSPADDAERVTNS